MSCVLEQKRLSKMFNDNNILIKGEVSKISYVKGRKVVCIRFCKANHVIVNHMWLQEQMVPAIKNNSIQINDQLSLVGSLYEYTRKDGSYGIGAKQTGRAQLIKAQYEM